MEAREEQLQGERVMDKALHDDLLRLAAGEVPKEIEIKETPIPCQAHTLSQHQLSRIFGILKNASGKPLNLPQRAFLPR